MGAVHRPDDIGVRDAGILEDHFGILIEAPAILVENLADAKARRIARDQKHGGAFPQGHIRIRPRVNEKEFPHAAIRDETFLAVENPFIAIAFGAKLQPGLGIIGRQAIVGTGTRFGDSFSEQEGIVFEKGSEKAALLLVRAARGNEMTPFPALAECFRDRAVSPGELRHDQRLGHEIRTVSTPLLRDCERAQAKLRALLDDVPVESLARIGNGIARKGDRPNLVLGKFARGHLPRALLIAQREIHGAFLVSLCGQHGASVCAAMPGDGFRDAQPGIGVGLAAMEADECVMHVFL